MNPADQHQHETGRLGMPDVLEAREQGADALSTVSLAKALQSWRAQGSQSFGVLSAHLDDLDAQANGQRSQRLAHDLRSLNLGYVKLLRRPASAGASPATAPQAAVSYFVVGISQQHTLRLATKYDQPAVAFLGPESDHELAFLRPGREALRCGPLSPESLSEGFSQALGVGVVFEYPVQGWSEALVAQHFQADNQQ